MVSLTMLPSAHVFTPFYDELGKAPMINECPINILCKVTQSKPISGFEMFFGETVAVYANEECLRNAEYGLPRLL